MITENKETVFDVRQIRPMIQFVPGNQDTTESRLVNVRKQMTFTRANKTIRRSGWYFTESYAPCGSGILCTLRSVDVSPFSAKPSGHEGLDGYKLGSLFGV